jgi:DNA adenine methylase
MSTSSEARDRPLSAPTDPDLSASARRGTAKPFLKWAGGKQRLCRLYDTLGLFPANSGTYFEAFVGGGAAFFYLVPEKAVLLDTNEELINTYKVVQKDVSRLIEELGEHNVRHRRYGAKHYYEVRSDIPSNRIERAARFVYLNKTCYNGLYRVNRAGEFNVPMGDYKNPQIVDVEGLRAASRALKDAKILHGDFQEVEAMARQGDFVYFDPPYDPILGKSSFTEYTKMSFGPLEQSTLASLFRRLAEARVKALISNSDTERIRTLYDGWWIHDIPASRAINSQASGRKAINELAITNFAPKPRGTLDSFLSN